MKIIDERIATLTAEKERIMTDYPTADSEIQTMLGMENMRISMELKFLNELNIAPVIGSLPFDFIKSFWSLSDDGIKQLEDAYTIWQKRQ